MHHLTQIIHLFFNQEPGGGFVHEPRDGHNRSMGAVTGAEGIIDVIVDLLGQATGKLFIIGRLFVVKPDVLQQKNLAFPELFFLLCHLFSDDAGCEEDSTRDKLGKSFRHGPEAELRDKFSFRPSQVGSDDEFCLVFEK